MLNRRPKLGEIEGGKLCSILTCCNLRTDVIAQIAGFWKTRGYIWKICMLPGFWYLALLIKICNHKTQCIMGWGKISVSILWHNLFSPNIKHSLCFSLGSLLFPQVHSTIFHFLLLCWCCISSIYWIELNFKTQFIFPNIQKSLSFSMGCFMFPQGHSTKSHFLLLCCCMI